MIKKTVVLAVLFAFICSVSAFAAAKVVETKLSEGDMHKIESTIHKAVKEAVIAKQGFGTWEYTAKRMKPPKNDKWIANWNEMGAEGWEAVDHFENVFIFKRPAIGTSSSYVKPASSPAEETPAVAPAAVPAEEKPTKADEKATKNAKKEADKAAKKAEKEAKKATKQAEKEAKKAAKDAEKAAKEASKKAE